MCVQASDAKNRLDARRKRLAGGVGASAPTHSEGADSLRGRHTIASIAASANGYRRGRDRYDGRGGEDGHDRQERHASRSRHDDDGDEPGRYDASRRGVLSPLAAAGAAALRGGGGGGGGGARPAWDTRRGGDRDRDRDRDSGYGGGGYDPDAFRGAARGGEAAALAEQRRRLEVQKQSVELELAAHRLHARHMQQAQFGGGFDGAGYHGGGGGGGGGGLGGGYGGHGFQSPMHQYGPPMSPYGHMPLPYGGAPQFFPPPWQQQQQPQFQMGAYGAPPPQQQQPSFPPGVDATAAAAAAVSLAMRSAGVSTLRPPAASTGGTVADIEAAAREDAAITALSALPPHILATDVAQRQLRLLLDRQQVRGRAGRAAFHADAGCTPRSLPLPFAGPL